VAHILKLKRLAILSLARTRVTEAGLTQIDALQDLMMLDLQGVKISDARRKVLDILFKDRVDKAD
jgi:hypothetical protein